MISSMSYNRHLLRSAACIMHRYARTRVYVLISVYHRPRYSPSIDYYLRLPLNYLQSTGAVTSKDNLDNFADLSLIPCVGIPTPLSPRFAE